MFGHLRFIRINELNFSMLLLKMSQGQYNWTYLVMNACGIICVILLSVLVICIQTLHIDDETSCTIVFCNKWQCHNLFHIYCLVVVLLESILPVSVFTF